MCQRKWSLWPEAVIQNGVLFTKIFAPISYQLSEKYDFITAWDSIWHIPLDEQVSVISKLASALNSDGIMIFSFGGVNEPGDHSDDTMGPEMYYSSIGSNGFIYVLLEHDCTIKHLEFDQYPELHTYIVAQKIA